VAVATASVVATGRVVVIGRALVAAGRVPVAIGQVPVAENGNTIQSIARVRNTAMPVHVRDTAANVDLPLRPMISAGATA
jgi:hypothetical protein